jgi:methyl-accepting chemotaxis protein
MDTGTELDDVMSTVKLALDKLAQAISKVDPILDDTKKMTGEASAASGNVRQSMAAMLANMEAISGQLKVLSESTNRLLSNADKSRGLLVSDLHKTLDSTNEAVRSAHEVINAVQTDLPKLLQKVQQSATDLNAMTDDAKRITQEARQQMPQALKAGRAVAQDAAELADGARRTWPLSGVFDAAQDAKLPLDGYEGAKP